MSPKAVDLPQEVLDGLTEQTRVCLTRLAVHAPELTLTPSAAPRTRLAAVLALLFERDGKLRVLLTTRSKALRSHPGQTALPGGKVDEGDESVAGTALREAHEEVSLPLSSPHVHVLTALHPFISAARLIVTPVVAFLSSPSLLSGLKANKGEVDRIFSYPLEAMIEPEFAREEELVGKGEDWPYDEELYHVDDYPSQYSGAYRYHRLRSCASPVMGLTADILMSVAEIAYARKTAFERWPSGQLVGVERVRKILEIELGKEAEMSVVRAEKLNNHLELGADEADTATPAV
ncbi:NUDIX hydrolase domain-like protein [Vararia minispora EC-137]|uniref:NUDIX hydrolase domain-like protein n=1 Tax=Vararia minispora EC-137 TaxID=1314806 RepID=A0ACB8QN37_9AGAM|nr:NUDIX hydrolase domain-like protein [Vararia minispora EC-137]